MVSFVTLDGPRSQEPTVHRDSGSSEPDRRRLLADGLGAGQCRHRHAHQASGQRLPPLPPILA